MTFLQSIFAGYLVVLEPFCLYEDFDDRYPKSLCQSLKTPPVIIFIREFISAYDSTTQDLAAKIHQKWPLLDQI